MSLNVPTNYCSLRLSCTCAIFLCNFCSSVWCSSFTDLQTAASKDSCSLCCAQLSLSNSSNLFEIKRKSCKEGLHICSDLLNVKMMLYVIVAHHLTFFSSTTSCWRASALLFSCCISPFMFSRLFLFCSSSIRQCTCTASTFSASHFLLSSSIALCT